jgi:hypothetical protein
MGREAKCKGKLGSQRSAGKALLETNEVIFRGDFRVKVPFKEITSLVVKGPNLALKWPEGELTLNLGAAEAPRWAEKIRNPPSRLDKLGVKPASTVAVLGTLEADLLGELQGRAARVDRKLGAPVDLLFFAAETRADLERLSRLKDSIVPDGAIWVVRRKGSPTISESDVMAMGKAAGLVDTKVAALSATHTGEKLVIPLAARPKATAATPRAKAAARAGRP